MADFAPQVLYLRQQDLIGKVAVVTGASRGIGRAIALNLASRGCSILGTCSSTHSLHLIGSWAEDLTQLYNQASPPISESRPKVYGLVADITVPNCPSLIADALTEEFGGKLDILINNAAVTGGTQVGSTDPEKVQNMLFSNVQTPLMIVDELVKRKLFRPCSRIINISSDRARFTSNASVIYSASKSALESLARTWAKVLGGTNPEFAFMAGSTANSISVGATESDAAKRLPVETKEERLREEMERQLIAPGGSGHFAQCEEVADVVGMLCSREARWITGSVVPANGGASVIL